MPNGIIKEEDFLGWTDAQREAYTFRMLVEIRDEMKRLTTVRVLCHTTASFIGGIVGGIVAMFGAARMRMLG